MGIAASGLFVTCGVMFTRVALPRMRLTISVVMVSGMMIRWITCGLYAIGIIRGRRRTSLLRRVVGMLNGARRKNGILVRRSDMCDCWV